MVRRDFGRDHHPLSRKLAQVLVTMAWPLAVLQNLWLVRQWFGPREALLKRAPGALWAAIRHNILPSEYYEYQLWQPDRRKNIDNYLFNNEAARLFKVLNQRSEIDPIVDKLAFYELCKTLGIPTPEVLAAFAPTGKLIDFRFGLPPQHDLFVKATHRRGWSWCRAFSMGWCSFPKQPRLPAKARGSRWLLGKSRTNREFNLARSTSSLEPPGPPLGVE